MGSIVNEQVPFVGLEAQGDDVIKRVLIELYMVQNNVEKVAEICQFCLIQLFLYRWMETILTSMQKITMVGSNNRDQAIM